ncbi:MAG: low specificity L-threonine aldolase [Rhodobacteraceae bacterium]|nr:low specificity L-threonine aldolase [Paracoccaceae bacterium]
MIFGSDNMAPVCPEAMNAITRANEGYASSYGADEAMQRVTAQIRSVFEAPDAAVYLVATGTAANSLALAVYTAPWQTVFCYEKSHIAVDECGAPEFYTNGAKLTNLGGTDGKITPEVFKAQLANYRKGDVHQVQMGSLSLTNVTEAGSVYTLDEIRTLTAIAKENGIACHLDGARFANAMVALGCTPADMTWKAGIDVVSFGGTKNGLMGVEAVVLFDPEKAWEFELRRKRAGHLFSKHRFLSAQMEAYLTDDLWIRLATQANAAGARLEEKLSPIEGFRTLYTRDANLMYCGWHRAGHERAKAAGAYYYDEPGGHPDSGPADEFLNARLVCNWSTTDAEIDRFAALVRG